MKDAMEESLDEESSSETRFIRRPMQKGLLAKALAYTNSAMRSSPPPSPKHNDIPHHNAVSYEDNCEVQHNTEVVLRRHKKKSKENLMDINVKKSSHKVNGDVTNNDVTNADMAEGDMRHLSFHSTQQLRSGFFRSIKKQYSPILQEEQESCEPVDGPAADTLPELHDFSPPKPLQEATSPANMAKFAKSKLQQFRKQGPGKIGVGNGLQWIRLELHEMREQDKSLFLQLIKLHSSIKELRAISREPSEFDSYDDLHSAKSLWWPRRGVSTSILPDFSSSDGAQLIKASRAGQHPPLRRGQSLNYPRDDPPYPYDIIHNGYTSIDPNHIRTESFDSESSHLSLTSVTSSTRSATAC